MTILRFFASCIGPCHIGSWAGPIYRLPIASRPSLLAGELGHVYSSAQAEVFASWLSLMMRDTRRAKAIRLTCHRKLRGGWLRSLWWAGAEVIHGWAQSASGLIRAAAIAWCPGVSSQVPAPEADICLSCFCLGSPRCTCWSATSTRGLATMREAHELAAEETFYDAERLRVEADLLARRSISPG